MPVNENHAKKGAQEPIRGLISQGGASVATAKVLEVARVLETVGWTALMTAALEADLRELERRNAARRTRKEGSKADTQSEAKARREAKSFKRKLELAFDDLQANARAEGRELPVGPDALDVGRAVRKNTGVLVEWLGRVRGVVELLKTDLATYFGGEDPVMKLDGVKAALAGADSTQESSIAQLPLSTQELYEIKGRLLLAIETLNRRGRIAFAEEAVKAALFNKDILLRARRTETDTGEGDPQI